jgi:hypothetical protein
MRLFRLGSVKAQKLTHAEKAQWIGMENRIPGFFLRQLMKVRVVDSYLITVSIPHDELSI